MAYNILTNQILILIRTTRVTRELLPDLMFDYWFRVRTDSTEDINVRPTAHFDVCLQLTLIR